MRRINTSTRYVIDAIGTGPISLREWGGVNWEKLELNEVFLIYKRVIGPS